MKKTIFAIIAGAGLAACASAQHEVQKPFEVSVGAAFFSGDLDDEDTGFLLGLDYYLGKNYGQQTMQFVGARGWFSDHTTAYGIHYGFRFGVPASQGMSGNLYFKLALGYYNNDIDGLDNTWGLGGFGAVGWEFGTFWGAELGYQIAPETDGVSNQSFFLAASFRM